MKQEMEKKVNIDDYRDQLGEDYHLVKELWEIFSSQNISILFEESLQKDEIPVGECTQLQKILLACLCVADTPTRQMLVQRAFLINAYKEFKIPHGTSLRVKKFFILAVKKIGLISESFAFWVKDFFVNYIFDILIMINKYGFYINYFYISIIFN